MPQCVTTKKGHGQTTNQRSPIRTAHRLVNPYLSAHGIHTNLEVGTATTYK